MKDMELVWNNIMVELQTCWIEQTKKLSRLPIPTDKVNRIDRFAVKVLRQLDKFGLSEVENISET